MLLLYSAPFTLKANVLIRPEGTTWKIFWYGCEDAFLQQKHGWL